MSEAAGEEGISKNALKKAQKAEEAAKKKAEKDAEKKAAAALAPPKAAKAGVQPDEEELDPTKYYENRLKQIETLEKSGDASAWPHKFHASMRISEYIKAYQDKVAEGESLDETVTVAGRILSKRGI